MFVAPSEVMNYKPTDPCVCGCKFEDHDTLDEVCWGCYYAPMHFSCFNFKLDNLRYIEDAAKRRKLI
jgi:hypothetical protein